jgi:glutamate-1-semialdehyde 2,1-aminomutase
MVNSGTKATISAIRLARGYSKKPKIIKFEGCYHGHGDPFLSKAGSGALTFGVPDSAGVPAELSALTVNVPYNDLGAMGKVFEEKGEDIAAVILEPIAGNMGVVPPADGYLQGVRRLTEEYGGLLIFDEVISGFRASAGGAQQLYGVTPDLTCLGKIIGGGLPMGAFGGRKEIMQQLAPLGPVYQAGTLSGNPLAVTAGLYMLRRIEKDPPYNTLERLGSRLEQGIRQNIADLNLELTVNRVGSVQTLFFNPGPVTDFNGSNSSDAAAFGRYFHAMLDQGIFLAPSQFEAVFVSTAHTEADIDRTVEANLNALKQAVS